MEGYAICLFDAIEKSGNNYDRDKISEALDFAAQAHEGQKRKSGEAYIYHPVEVAKILILYDGDTDSIIASLLHDIVEDTPISLDIVRKKFGSNVALLVDGVTKLGKISYSSKEEQQIENLRKMLLAMAKDIRVILIKLADRLHNMRTMDSQTEEKRREKALETIEVYAPLAHRLGIQNLKSELEDISLHYLDPIGYKEIQDNLDVYENNAIFDEIKKIIADKLEEVAIPADIDGRIKHIYSIYRKMFNQNKAFNEIYDLYAYRII
ncbi:MAG: relA, partial [Clostridia bacterium]|nr:relA [Clostridia bacterium]